jgi:hypothetical protein
MSAYPKVDLKPYFDLLGEIIEEGQEQGFLRKDIYLSAVKKALFGAVDETCYPDGRSVGRSIYSWPARGEPKDESYLASIRRPLFPSPGGRG